MNNFGYEIVLRAILAQGVDGYGSCSNIQMVTDDDALYTK